MFCSFFYIKIVVINLYTKTKIVLLYLKLILIMDQQQIIILKCRICDCEWTCQSSFGGEQSFKLTHVDHHQANQRTLSLSVMRTSKVLKLQPPKIEAGVDSET